MGHIVVDNVGKAYKRYPNRWSRLLEWFDPTNRPRHEAHWVFRGVSFEVAPGEAVGIVGQNGAGKSTLLKLITGTTQATEGQIQIGGRIAALLELGMGFHPDFTGRQNCYMAGQLLGLSAGEITALMPHIEGFAEIGDYMDQPVRTYSSGMHMRVAFAVATVSRPDILIVDEALAVGDAAFQRKCFRRIEEFIKQGTTLLYVSHDIEGVKKMCKKALWLSRGAVGDFGPAKIVCDQYERELFNRNHPTSTLVPHNTMQSKSGDIDPALVNNCEFSYGDGRATIEHIWLETTNGQTGNIFNSDEDIILSYRVHFHEACEKIAFAFMLKTKEGISLCGSDTVNNPNIPKYFNKNQYLLVKFRLRNNLAPNIYYLNCGVRDDSGEIPVFLHRRVDTYLFRVKNDGHTFFKMGLFDLLKSVEAKFE